jgi:hypothetical protein
VKETLCQENMRGKTCMHISDVPETPDDAGMHADNTYKEKAVDKTCLERTTGHHHARRADRA